MVHSYESEILHQLMEREGFNTPSSVPPYESDIKAYFIEQVKLAYPKLTDYEAEWLIFNLTGDLPDVPDVPDKPVEPDEPDEPDKPVEPDEPEEPDKPDKPVEFTTVSVSNVTQAHFENVVPSDYQEVILKGSMKYHDIDTGEILETFEKGRNLELVSAKMPVLTSTNGDGTKSNILTVNEDVTLRAIGEVQDTLDCLTGEVTERIGEVVLDGSNDEYWMTDGQIGGSYKFLVALKNPYYTHGQITTNAICDKFPSINNGETKEQVLESICINGWVQGKLNLAISKTKLSSGTVDELRRWLSQNPLTVQYQLATESVKTVDLRCVNENSENVSFIPLDGVMNVSTSSETIQPTFDMTVTVEVIPQNLSSFIDMEVNHE